ncbi:MAG: 4Fe-4S binding protein [Muribaculaceae bacterium]|nr:4Fe-4S binding protein [Muribaculaceae bacterium]
MKRKNRLRTLRIVFALLCFLAISLLFLDFTGTAASMWGWIAKLQVVPAVLSLNIMAIVILIMMTLLFGRAYCSVLCPLGVLQDIINHIRGRVGKRKNRINRFGYRPPLTLIRICFLVGFIAVIALGLTSLAALVEPYSEFGRIMSAFMSPLYDMCNNLLADAAEDADSYMFYRTPVRLLPAALMIVAGVTLAVVACMAWFGGRIYCNSICPVGTVLGYLGRYSWLKPVIDVDKCNGCKKCARNCKSSCIDAVNHKIDYTRCVACMDCIGECSTGAIRYIHPESEDDKRDDTAVNGGRRAMLSVGALMVGGAVGRVMAKSTDGGLAEIIDKQPRTDRPRIVPPGALSIKNLERNCVACQLCIQACPNGVLRPSMEAATFMQPVVEYDRGYCRPECNSCATVCPAGAIKPIDLSEKCATQVGHAVVTIQDCLSASEGVRCGNCERHCPVGAISMITLKADNPDSPLVPVVDEERCIGCGACENLCPVRPLSAIHVVGHEKHRII